jgi:hypothetical protein
LLQQLGHHGIRERAYFYADDVVLFVKPDQLDLVLTKAILDIFAAASGLSINKNKCLLNPIQCSLEETVTLRFFPGRLQAFPYTYVGVPLSVTKLKRNDLQPLIDRVSSNLPTWKAGMMTAAGRAVLVKTKMSAVPVHTAIATAISSWAIQQIDKRRRAFLWKGTATDLLSRVVNASWPGHRYVDQRI